MGKVIRSDDLKMLFVKYVQTIHTHTKINLKYPVCTSPEHISFDCGRNPEGLERTHTDMGRTRKLQPKTFLLCHKSAKPLHHFAANFQRFVLNNLKMIGFLNGTLVFSETSNSEA